MANSKLVKANETIAREVVAGYKKIEDGVVGGYKKIEEGTVEGFNKIADKFVDNFLTREGESVEEARARLAAEQREREQGLRGAAGQRAENRNAKADGKAGLE